MKTIFVRCFRTVSPTSEYLWYLEIIGRRWARLWLFSVVRGENKNGRKILYNLRFEKAAMSAGVKFVTLSAIVHTVVQNKYNFDRKSPRIDNASQFIYKTWRFRGVFNVHSVLFLLELCFHVRVRPAELAQNAEHTIYKYMILRKCGCADEHELDF